MFYVRTMRTPDPLQQLFRSMMALKFSLLVGTNAMIQEFRTYMFLYEFWRSFLFLVVLLPYDCCLVEATTYNSWKSYENRGMLMLETVSLSILLLPLRFLISRMVCPSTVSPNSGSSTSAPAADKYWAHCSPWRAGSAFGGCERDIWRWAMKDMRSKYE